MLILRRVPVQVLTSPVSTFFKYHFQLQGYNALLQLPWCMHVTDAVTFFVINHKQPLDKTAVFLKHIPHHLQGWSHFSMSHLWLGRTSAIFPAVMSLASVRELVGQYRLKMGSPPPSLAFVWLLKYPSFWTDNRLHFTVINKKTAWSAYIWSSTIQKLAPRTYGLWMVDNLLTKKHVLMVTKKVLNHILSLFTSSESTYILKASTFFSHSSKNTQVLC